MLDFRFHKKRASASWEKSLWLLGETLDLTQQYADGGFHLRASIHAGYFFLRMLENIAAAMKAVLYTLASIVSPRNFLRSCATVVQHVAAALVDCINMIIQPISFFMKTGLTLFRGYNEDNYGLSRKNQKNVTNLTLVLSSESDISPVASAGIF